MNPPLALAVTAALFDVVHPVAKWPTVAVVVAGEDGQATPVQELVERHVAAPGGMRLVALPAALADGAGRTGPTSPSRLSDARAGLSRARDLFYALRLDEALTVLDAVAEAVKEPAPDTHTVAVDIHLWRAGVLLAAGRVVEARSAEISTWPEATTVVVRVIRAPVCGLARSMVCAPAGTRYVVAGGSARGWGTPSIRTSAHGLLGSW